MEGEHAELLKQEKKLTMEKTNVMAEKD